MLNLLAVALFDGGVVAFAVGAVSLVRPLRVIGIGSRAQAVAVAAAGVCVALAGMLMPAPLEAAETARTDLDRAMPVWQFREHHHVHVEAPADRVYRAFGAVTAEEILLFRTLTWIRHPRVRR